MALLCSTAATAATYYGFKIGDVQVTSDNYTNVTGDNITGSVKYDPSTSIVTLTNVTISLTGSYKRAIINESHSGGLIVKLVGSNTLRAADAAGVRLSSGTSMAIYMTEGSNTVIQSIDEEGIWVTSNSNYSLEIYGTGSLAVKSNSKAAIASDEQLKLPCHQGRYYQLSGWQHINCAALGCQSERRLNPDCYQQRQHHLQ